MIAAGQTPFSLEVFGRLRRRVSLVQWPEVRCGLSRALDSPTRLGGVLAQTAVTSGLSARVCVAHGGLAESSSLVVSPAERDCRLLGLGILTG